MVAIGAAPFSARHWLRWSSCSQARAMTKQERGHTVDRHRAFRARTTLVGRPETQSVRRKARRVLSLAIWVMKNSQKRRSAFGSPAKTAGTCEAGKGKGAISVPVIGAQTREFQPRTTQKRNPP